MSALDVSVDDGQDDAGPVAHPARWALGLSTAVCWFFVHGASVLLFGVQAGVAELTTGTADVTSALLVLPLAAFAAPLLTLAPRWGRDGVVTRSALLSLGAGALTVAVLLAIAAGYARGRTGLLLLALLGAILVAAGAVFLMSIVGLVNRRSVAGGLVGALLLRQLHAAIGGFHIGWIAMTAGVVLLGLVSLRRWRASPGEERGDTFERRTGGIRLRGALALGAILFLELALNLPVRGQRYPLEASTLGISLAMIPPALAWLFVVRGLEAPRHRLLAVAGAVAVGVGLLLSWRVARVEGSLLAHAAALMLVGRALSPASGRRLGKHLTIGLFLFALLALVLDYGVSTGRSSVSGAAVVVAVLVLVAMMYLTPRPARAGGALPDPIAFAIALALPLLAALAAALRHP